MWRTQASAPWMRVALAVATALGLAIMSAAAQRSSILINGRNLQIPINHGLPDKPLGFTFCRLRYQNIRRARKSGWGDDYPQADYNFMVRLSELTTTRISRWNNGDPGFANVTAMDPDLFRCPYLRMQNAANYDFTPEESARLHDYLVKGGFLYVDDFWGTQAWEQWAYEIGRVLPPHQYPIVDIEPTHPVMNVLYDVKDVEQVSNIRFWVQTGSTSERGGDSAHVNFRGISDEKGRLMVVMAHNTDIPDTWEREGESKEYFDKFSPNGYAVGVNVVLYGLTH